MVPETYHLLPEWRGELKPLVEQLHLDLRFGLSGDDWDRLNVGLRGEHLYGRIYIELSVEDLSLKGDLFEDLELSLYANGTRIGSPEIDCKSTSLLKASFSEVFLSSPPPLPSTPTSPSLPCPSAPLLSSTPQRFQSTLEKRRYNLSPLRVLSSSPGFEPLWDARRLETERRWQLRQREDSRNHRT